jgi:glycosyltransferase involved in cell wall biosynthesis
MSNTKSGLLLLTPYYYPDIAANTILMKELVDCLSNDYNVTIFTNGIRNDIKSESNDAKQIKYRVIRSKNRFSRKRGILAKAFEYMFFYINTYLHVKNRKINYGVIFCQSTPPLISIFVKIAVKNKAKIIYNVQDIFPDSLIPYFGNRKYRILHQAEKLSYKLSDSIITISNGFSRKIRNRSGIIAHVVYNWVDTQLIKYVDNNHNDLFKEYELFRNKNKNIVYSGNIGFNQDFDTLLDVAEKMKKQKCNFIIIGKGKSKEKLKNKIARRNINNVYLFDPLPPDKIASVYSFGDVYILPMKKYSLEGSFPSKTWSILACGSPLVVSVDRDSEYARELENKGLAYICKPSDSEDMKDKIEIALSENRRYYSARTTYIKDKCDKEKNLLLYKIIVDQMMGTV